MDCFIGLDIGTSAIKGVLVSKNGEILAKASGEFDYSVSDNHYLLEPNEFLTISLSVLKKLATRVNKGDKIAAICPCCASGNLLLLDNENKPLTHIIGWQNAVEQAEFDTYYTESDYKEIYNKVGWPIINGFPIAFLPWLSKNKRELLEKAQIICMSAEYLGFALTGKWGISVSMATPFYVCEQEKGIYNKKLLKTFGISEDKLPPIYEKGTVLGETIEGNGIPSGIPIVLGSFDHPSCATGAGVYGFDEVLLSCGTSWVEFFPVETREKAISTGLLVDKFMLDGAPYCVMSSVTSLGERINLLRKHYLGDISHKDLDLLIEKAPKGSNGLTFSFDDTDFDITGFSSCDIARAIYESAAKLLKKNLEDAHNMGLGTKKITMVGGITNSAVCMQVIADVLEKEITVVNGVSAGAVGAAMLAGIGVKTFANEKLAFEEMNFSKVIYNY